jgi:hypothetical protein
VIRAPTAPLASREQYGLTVLLDVSRLLPVEDPHADVVPLMLSERDDPADTFDAFARGAWRFERADGSVTISRALLAHVAALAGGGAERDAVGRDGNHVLRVPPEANPLVRTGRFREPVLNRLGMALREAVVSVAGRRAVRLLAPWPDGRRWAAAFTHDLDVVAAWPLFTGLRLLELARKGAVGRALRTIVAAGSALVRNPVSDAIAWLLALEADAGIRSTWFVLCGTPTFATLKAGDLTYRPESPRARRIVDAVVQGGHEVGLHGSFATLVDAHEFSAQRNRLAALTQAAPQGVRQHFLRLRPGATQQAMVAAGFRYDATLGFHDRNGFRIGAADVVPGWDPATDAPLAFDEVPLIWMDRALSKYRGIEDPDAWVADALELVDACRQVEGLWVGLWHPNLAPALGYPGAPAAYERLVHTVMAERPFVAPLGEIVQWRAARRSARARTVAGDDRIQLSARTPAGPSLVLEDAAGRPIREGEARSG